MLSSLLQRLKKNSKYGTSELLSRIINDGEVAQAASCQILIEEFETILFCQHKAAISS